VNLDAGGIAPKDLSIDQVPMAIADAELSVGFQFKPDLSANATLVNDEGTVVADQAYAKWNSPWLDISAGKQSLPLGLYASHLIHDPLLTEDLETIAPSVLGSKEWGMITGHLAAANPTYRTILTEIDGSETDVSSAFPAILAAIDVKWGEEGVVRLSGSMAHHCRILSVGAQIPMGSFALDLEGMATDGAWAQADLAALAGLAWKPLESLELATRFDARKEHTAGVWTKTVAAGATFAFAEIVHTGIEWTHDLDGDGVLTVRAGLEGDIRIP
jgi:hypothetical protein